MLKMAKKLLDMLEKPLNKVLGHPVLGGLLKVFLVLYSSVIAPKLPDRALRILTNKFVRVVVLALIVYTGTRDLPTAMLISVAFVVTMLGLAKMETVQTISGVMDVPVDAVQEVANDVVDGVQDLTKEVVDMTPLPKVVSGVVGTTLGFANGIIDTAQDISNYTIDSAQSVIRSVSSLADQ